MSNKRSRRQARDRTFSLQSLSVSIAFAELIHQIAIFRVALRECDGEVVLPLPRGPVTIT